jgi:hypothetical protein
VEGVSVIVATGISATIIGRFVANSAQLDGATLVPLGIAVIVMVFVGRWIWNYSRDSERQRAQLAAQRKLLRYIIEKSRDVSEYDPKVQEMIEEMETDEK